MLSINDHPDIRRAFEGMWRVKSVAAFMVKGAHTACCGSICVQKGEKAYPGLQFFFINDIFFVFFYWCRQVGEALKLSKGY